MRGYSYSELVKLAENALPESGGVATGDITAPNFLVSEEQGVTPNSVVRRDFLEAITNALGAQGDMLEIEVHEVLRRSYAEAGYVLRPRPESFETGGTLTGANDVLLHKATGIAHSSAGPYPVTVPLGTLPGAVGFTNRQGELLRAQLRGVDGLSSIGSTNYAGLRAYAGVLNNIRIHGRVNRGDGGEGEFRVDPSDTTSPDNDGTILVDSTGKRWKRSFSLVDMKWFGITDGGVVDNANAFSRADALGRDLLISGNGTYLTTYEPKSRVYTDAKAKVKIGAVTMSLSQVPLLITATEQAEFDDTKVRLSNTQMGVDAAPLLLSNANSYGNTAIATGAMQNAVEAQRVTAIGPFAVRDPVKAYSVTGIGTTTLEWMAYGDRLTFVGDNSGKNLGNPNPVGRHAYFDPDNPNPNGWDTRWPEWRSYAGTVNAPAQVMSAADFGKKATHMVGVGRNAFGFSLTAKDGASLGYDAGTSLLYGQDCVFIGDRSGQWTIKGDLSTWGGSKAARYLMDSNQDTGWGYLVGANYVRMRRNTITGYQAMAGFQCNLDDFPESNSFYGRISGANAKGSIKYDCGFGENTLTAVQSNGHTATGHSALSNHSDPLKGNCTANGYLAMTSMQDLTPCVSVENSSGFGYQARVSGDNQVQLGNSATTTYVFGTVQNRSDRRDKTDVNDTVLGIDFIMGLRPVDGRWDLRDDYVEEYQVQIGIDENAEPVFENRYREIPKDGSKARKRLHHWFIAQEVKELCDKLGVEFGGYQDHKVLGGSDVLTLGYDEFIPPAVKAIQQCWEEIQSIKGRLDKAGI